MFACLLTVAMITPTCGSIMAGLELAHVGYGTYIKTVAKYMALLTRSMLVAPYNLSHIHLDLVIL